MPRAKELVKNTFIITIGKFSTQIISFILLPLYTSKLTPDEYGNYDLTVTIATFIVPIITMLLEEAMFRFLIDAKNEKEKEKIINNVFVFITFSTIIFSTIMVVLSRVLDYNLGYYITIYSVSTTIVALTNALSRGEGKVFLFSVSNFLISLINIILSIFFIVILKLGFCSLIYSATIANVVISLYVLGKLNIKKQIKIKELDIRYLLNMLKYSIPLVPNTICWSTINLSDRLFIVNQLGAGANGIYSISYKFPNILNNFYSYFNIAWRETSARIANDGAYEEEYKKIYKQMKNILFSVCLLLISTIPFVFKILIDTKYIEGLKYIPILCISVYYSSISGFYGGIFTAFKDTKILGITSCIAAIVNIIINAIFINKIGLIAAAISTVISSYILYIIRKEKSKKYVKIDNNIDNFCYFLLFILFTVMYYISNLYIEILMLIIAIIITVKFNKNILQKIYSTIKNKCNLRGNN